MPESSTAAFDADVARALRAVGAESADLALDPLSDPAGAARALSAEGQAPLLLRVGPELGAPARAGSTPFAPAPRDPVWLRIERGARALRLAPLRLAAPGGARPERQEGASGAGGGSAASYDAVRVEVAAQQRPCCGAASCARERTHASAWLVLATPSPAGERAAGEGAAAERAAGEGAAAERAAGEGAAAERAAGEGAAAERAAGEGAAAERVAGEGAAAERAAGERRLLVAEAQDLDAAKAEALVEAVAAPLARALRVPLQTARAVEPPDDIAPRPFPEPAPEPAPQLTAAALSRLALRSEGEALVLRDHASLGPRASALRNGLIGAALLIAGLALSVQALRSAYAGDSGVSIGAGSAAALLLLAGYAFLGVARFSSRYTARSAPLLSLSQGRFVVAPWVSRAGAIDLRPEGRLGAAISAGEVHATTVRARGDLFAVELATDHGPIDVLLTDREEVARYWRDATDRAIAAVLHAGGPSAKQRLRARVQSQQPAVAR